MRWKHKKNSATYILVQEVVESVGQALPRDLEERHAQQLLEVQQVVPHAKHHGTRRAGQRHGGLVALGGQGQPPDEHTNEEEHGIRAHTRRSFALPVGLTG